MAHRTGGSQSHPFGADVDRHDSGAAQTRLHGVDSLAAAKIQDPESAERAPGEVAGELHDPPDLDPVRLARLGSSGPCLPALSGKEGERIGIELVDEPLLHRGFSRPGARARSWNRPRSEHAGRTDSLA